MTALTNLRNLLPLLLLAGTQVLYFSCEAELDELEPAAFPTDGEVFIDGFPGGLNYAAFGGSDVTAFQVDEETTFSGTAAMRFAVPDFEDPRGAYAGGAYFLDVGRDLSGYNALTFYARATRAATLDVVGLGNDLGASRYQATLSGGLAVNTNWRKYFIPIPDPAKLTQERGLFFYSEGPEEGRGYTFWIDELRYERVPDLGRPRGFVFDGEDRRVDAATGTTFRADSYTLVNLPTGVDQRVETAPAYFTFTSSDPSVATVDASGTVTVRDTGTATITARLGDEPATGSLTVGSRGAAPAPAAPAPTPDRPANAVISLFSDAYADVPVDFYNGFWEFSTTQSEIVPIAGNDAIYYTDLNFVGIQFTSPTIDVSAMSHLRLDLWTAEPTAAPAEFKVLLFDLGPDGAFGGEDDSSHEITLTAPTLRSEEWVTLELPLSDFAGLTGRRNLAQIVLSGTLPTVYVDNVLFYAEDDGGGGGGGGSGTEPTAPAPPPTRPAADVVSLFSDAYDDVAVDTWRTDWSAATLTDTDVAGNAVKRYTMLDFVGVETTSSTLDVREMTHVHVDVWTPDATFFALKLVDFGADGAFAGGDDVEHQVEYPAPPQGRWVSYDIPLSDFAGLTTRANLAQYIFVARPSGAATIYLDNVYFYRE